MPMEGTSEKPILNPNGLTDDECKELHAYFMKGLYGWAAVAAVAHALVWSWLPWFPG